MPPHRGATVGISGKVRLTMLTDLTSQLVDKYPVAFNNDPVIERSWSFGRKPGF